MTDKDVEGQTWFVEPPDDAWKEGGSIRATAPQPEPQPEPTTTVPQPIPFEFRGDAREYFKIWIVNLALTLVTLGIYSPWAKVRKLRYFYGNTYLDGSSFEFLGSPIAILKGRIIAVLAFGSYWLAANFYPVANLVLLPVFAVFFPWVFVKTLTFRSRNSAYRNLTFSYQGRYLQIAAAYLGFPLLLLGAGYAMFHLAGISTLPASPPAKLSPEDGRKAGMIFGVIAVVSLIVFPYFYYLQKRAFVAPRRFGDTAFGFAAGPKDFYGLLIKTLFVVMLGLVIMGGMSVWLSSAKVMGVHRSAAGGSVVTPIMIMLFILLVELLLFVTFITWTRNLVLSALRIGAAQLASRLRVGEIFLLYLTNIIAIVCTLGLLIPWAKVRLMRYQMSKTSLLAPQGTENFTGGPGQSASAVGEELAEFFDLDLSL